MVSFGPEGHVLRLEGFSVVRCLVDFGLSIQLARWDAVSVPSQEDVVLRIEAPFEYIHGSAVRHCDVEQDPTTAGSALELRGHTVESAIIDLEGNLHMTFNDRTVLYVGAQPELESCTITGPNGLLIVCGPGSRVSVFPPKLNLSES